MECPGSGPSQGYGSAWRKTIEITSVIKEPEMVTSGGRDGLGSETMPVPAPAAITSYLLWDAREVFRDRLAERRGWNMIGESIDEVVVAIPQLARKHDGVTCSVCRYLSQR